MSGQSSDTPLFDLAEVEYRDIPYFPGYRVGDDGTVWTRWKARGGHFPGGRAKGGMVLGNDWKLLKQWRRGGNRAWSVRLGRNGKSFPKFVHRLVLEAFVGPCPPGLVCRHGPHGKYNNNLYNLCWGTIKDNNSTDRERDGTRVFGVVHHNAKMNPENVRAARRQHAEGASCLGLSKKYGIAQSTMDSILKCETWREVV